MSKLPAFQFYPGDWMKDPNLRRCTKSEKGMWIDMLCLLFECEERGVFITDNRAWTREEIAEAVAGDVAANLLLLDGLLNKGVAKIDKRHAIFSARMTRDEKLRRNKSEAGKNGMASRWDNTPDNRTITDPITEGITKEGSSSSVSSSASASHKENEKYPSSLMEVFAIGDLAGVPRDVSEKFWNHYEGNGWLLGNGLRVQKWRNTLAEWKTTHAERQHKEKKAYERNSGKTPGQRTPTIEEHIDVKTLNGG